MDVNINLENISLAVASSSSEGLKARSDLVRITESHIAPAVRRIVNEDPRFAMLRTVHRSRALAQAYRELQKERVALASLEESLNLKMLPAPTLRDPKTIWQQYVGELKAAKFTTSVPFTGGVFELRSGGVVLDAVRFATVSESEAFARPSPYAPGRGLLIATAHGSRPASLERIAIAKALDGYRAMKPGDRAAVAAAELLPALALLRHADYAAVRREVAVDPASAIYLAIADGIRDGSREHEGNGALAGLDSLSFAIWSRVDPRSAARAAIETTSLPRLLSYLLAVTAYPRTGDLSPQVALEAAMRFASDSPEAQAKYLARLAQISAVVAPAAATVIVDRLTDQAHAGAMIDALPEVLEAVEALAKLNEKEAVRLFSVFLGVLRNEGYDPQLPEIKRVNETLNDLIAWKGRSGKSSDLRDQARYVRALWLERPADALPAADELSRAIRQRKSSDATEQAFMDVLPILARRDPQLAMELADGLHEPLARMVVFSQLAAHAANPTAANIRLAQSIALELEAWVKSRR